MKTLVITLALICTFINGCCPKQNRLEPSYPKDVSGWEGSKDKDGKVSRKFVLKKGETTDNGEIQIKLSEIIEPNPCAEGGTFQRQARARIQFIRLSDQKIICNDT